MADQAPGSLPTEGSGKLSLCIAATMFLVGYLFSQWYLYAYYYGDAQHYDLFYNSLYGIPPEHWKTFQQSYLGSAEPLYRYLIGAAAYFGLDRINYLSIWNGVLTGSIGYILSRYRASALFAALIFTNYYLLVILGPAERLKFAYIALALAACLTSIRGKYALYILSVFFHTQAAIQFASAIGHYLTKYYRDIFTTPLRTIVLGVAIAGSLGASAYLFLGAAGTTLAAKSSGYASSSGGAMEIVQWALLLAAGTYVFRDRLAYVVGMLPIGVATFLFGNRVNVATFAFFVFLALAQRKTSHPVVLAVMGYMSYKSIGFVADVMKYGTGYL